MTAARSWAERKLVLYLSLPEPRSFHG